MSNQITAAPLYDTLQQLKSEVFKGLRVCVPGSVYAVDTVKMTVDVTVGLMQQVAQPGTPTGIPASYPRLLQCPVLSTQGGGVGVVMPIKAGDECLVVFSDRCIERWFTTGGPQPLPSFRMHDIADGFAIVGLNSLRNKLVTTMLSGEGGLCETGATVAAVGAKVAIDPVTHKVSISNLEGLNSMYLILKTSMTALSVDGGLSNETRTVVLAALAQLDFLMY